MTKVKNRPASPPAQVPEAQPTAAPPDPAAPQGATTEEDSATAPDVETAVEGAEDASQGQQSTDVAESDSVAPAPPEAADGVRALVLMDCIYGKVNQVKSFPRAEAEAAAAAGYIDLHPAAIRYGESLVKS